MKRVTVKELTSTHERGNEQKHTNVFITINTNKSDMRLIPQFKQACREVFNNIEEYIDYRDVKRVGEAYIDNISVQYKIEIGGIKHLIHVHALVKIAHHTFIRLLTREIKEDLRQAMNIQEDFHLDVKYLKAMESELNIIEYMQKNSYNINAVE